MSVLRVLFYVSIVLSVFQSSFSFKSTKLWRESSSNRLAPWPKSRLPHNSITSRVPHSSISTTPSVLHLSPMSNSECPVNDEIGAAALFAELVVAYSLATLATTGCGLPPGPFGLEGALEGVSWLGWLALVGWSAFTIKEKGYSLPVGDIGLLGFAELVGYILVAAGLLVGIGNMLHFGYLPGFLPSEVCFGA